MAPLQPDPTPTVSVIIPHYGDPNLGLRLVAQLETQLDAPRMEIVIADDHSPEPFPALPGIRVVRRAKNGGFGANVNTGVGDAEGQFLLILNSDVEIGPTFVRDLLTEALALGPSVLGPAVTTHGVVSPSAGPFPRVLHQALHWSRAWGVLSRRGVVQAYLGRGTFTPTNQTERVDWVTGAAMLLGADDYARVGGFNEQFFMFGEECDLQYRLAEVGVKAFLVGSVHVEHEGGGSTPSEKEGSWRLEGVDRYFRCRGRAGQYRAAVTGVLVSNLAWDVFALILGRPRHPWAALRADLRRAWRPERRR